MKGFRRVFLLILTALFVFVCYGCGRPEDWPSIGTESIDRDYLIIPYAVKKASYTPYTMWFPGNDSTINKIKKVVDDMTSDQFDLKTTLYKNKYLLIERSNKNEDKTSYFLLMDTKNDPYYNESFRYIYFGSYGFTDEHFYKRILMPYHLMPELGLKNIHFNEEGIFIGGEKEYEIEGAMQDFIDFYSKAKGQEVVDITDNSFTLNAFNYTLEVDFSYKFIFTDKLRIEILLEYDL